MAETVKFTPYGVTTLRFDFGLNLADKPAVLGEAMTWTLVKVGSHQHKRIESVKAVAVEPSPNPDHAIVNIELNTTEVLDGVEQDYTALKQELAARISEALKSSKGGK